MEKRPMAAGPCPGSGPIRILVSACLLGEKVRYDGGHKRDAFIADTLGRLVECVPVCPETKCGLPTPREAMRLLRNAAGLRLVTVDTGVDQTGRMGAWARRKLKDLSRLELSGYICKEGSPSCGLERVPVFGASGAPPHTAGGIFTRLFMERFPNVPVEDERRLKNPDLRKKFLDKVLGTRRNGRRRGVAASRPPRGRCRRGRAPRGSMRRFRRGARARRTRCGTAREGNEAGADAAALECRHLREWPRGGRSAAARIHRAASHERRPPSEAAQPQPQAA